MSVINQMLNGLEQRGVQIAAEQVRPVREVRDFRKTIIAVLLVALVLPGAWFLYRHKGTAPVPVAAVAEVKPELPKPKPKQPAHRSPAAIKEGGKEKQAIKSSAPVEHAAAKTDHPLPAHNEKLAQSPPLPPIKQISAAQQADAEFSGASLLMQQGRTAEAQAGFEAALRLDAGHVAARQSLVASLLEAKRGNEAEQLLQDGLKIQPTNAGFAMLLARLQVQRGEVDQAIATLDISLMRAGQSAEYHAFYAALLQRKNRHAEAVEHYQIALKAAPKTAAWLMGYGISLQALARVDEAKEAYQRALDTKNLSPELQTFVQQKIHNL